MSIDTYPPQSTQATVLRSETVQWTIRNFTTNVAGIPNIWLDSALVYVLANWRVPESYAGGNVAFTLLRHTDVTTGTARMNYAVVRFRDGTAELVIIADTAINFAPGDTLSHSLVVAVPAGTFAVGDTLQILVSRLGADAGDTSTGIVFCEDIAVTYNAYVMGYAAYPASVNNASYEEGSFTVTATGFSGTAPSGTVSYVRVGKQVTARIPFIDGTSNATTFTLTGWSAALLPAVSQDLYYVVRVVDNNVNQTGLLSFLVGGVVSVRSSTAGGSVWTASGNKSLYASAITYTIA